MVALAGDTGAEVWTMAVDNGKRGVYPGRAGGLALVENMLAVHAARRDLAMLDANTGEIRWAVSHDAPLQAGPTFIGNEAVLVSDIEGQLYAYTDYWRFIVGKCRFAGQYGYFRGGLSCGA